MFGEAQSSRRNAAHPTGILVDLIRIPEGLRIVDQITCNRFCLVDWAGKMPTPQGFQVIKFAFFNMQFFSGSSGEI
jgi:hypothetical protein